MHPILESKTIPKSAGCYLFKNDKEQVIYVGKSKYLPKRVANPLKFLQYSPDGSLFASYGEVGVFQV